MAEATESQRAASASNAAGPTAVAERMALLDTLRGALLYFIFLANLPAFSAWMFLPPAQRGTGDGLGRWLEAAGTALVMGKFYSLFALLFGIGFALFLARQEGRGDGPALYRRRTAVLAGFGLLHMLVWPGDILLPYALCALILLPFRRAADATLLRAAGLLIAAPVAYYALAWASGGRSELGGWIAQATARWLVAAVGSSAGPFETYRSGDLTEVLGGNLIGFGFRWADLLYEGRLFKVLGVFLLGLWVGRRLLDGRLPGDAALLRRVLRVGLAVGLPANLALAALHGSGDTTAFGVAGLLKYASYALGVVPLALAYAAGFALLWRRDAARRVMSVFAPAGRMALSNYLLQTAIGIGLYYGIGLGLAGEHGPADWPWVALVVVAAQLALSALWLRHFRAGPMEKLWRVLTYGRRRAR